MRPHHTGLGTVDGLQRHAPRGGPAHRQTGVPSLHIGQWTRGHLCQRPEHQPHSRAGARATRHHTPQPPAAPVPDTLSNTAPPLDTQGHAIHGQRQTVPIPHANPTARHHTAPPGEHRAPATPRELRPYPPLLLSPSAGKPPCTPTKSPTPTCPQATAPTHRVLPMVHTPLHPFPRGVHQMHLWPNRGRNLGPIQDMAPVPGAQHPNGLEVNPHNCTTHRMADTVPGNLKTRHHPESDGGTRGGPQGACPHCRLHPATHPRGRPRGNSSTHATDGCHQSGRATHVPHPQVTAAWQHPALVRPRPPPQTRVPPTVTPGPAT